MHIIFDTPANWFMNGFNCWAKKKNTKLELMSSGNRSDEQMPWAKTASILLIISRCLVIDCLGSQSEQASNRK